MREETFEVIEICWDGPHTPEQVIADMHGPADFGVYQIYGTHDVLGSDTLLYIGKARNRPFGVRLEEHQNEWIEWQPGTINVYLGRIGCTESMTEKKWPEWNERIDWAGKLLIYFCAPPYNSQGIKNAPDLPALLVANFKRKHRLPLEVSTLLISSPIGSRDWKIYGT